jgi:hypothetical protein
MLARDGHIPRAMVDVTIHHERSTSKPEAPVFLEVVLKAHAN